MEKLYVLYDPRCELCRRLKLPYLYLGYWIGQSRKMAYKINFQPMEGLVNGQWQRLRPSCL